ncbi:FkbM family methyltransferase [Metabacillus idriensis]|uniref:FkbM family methyltransferase n=1 Tax=Metabacillus idriensis TaxID=324768 RepID=UPI00174D7977|nr:FkbM family methyltransferase [Metabacillus idriensis]
MINKASVRKPFFMKLWEHYPKIWKGLIDLGILMKYKTLDINKIPNKIVLPSTTILYVNSEENRGRALLISNGVTQKRLLHFWRQAVGKYRPDTIIDIGVNYGECIFSAAYPAHTKIYGIEANQNLLTYINRSRDAHPNKSQITIVHAFASDKDGEDKVFFVDNHWSGTSSASYMPTHQMVEKVSVKSITVDSLFNKDMADETILFKVDVEGYEAFVLKGMTSLFEKSASVIGFIEFNSEYFDKTGFDADEFFSFLTKYFTIFIYKENDVLIKAEQLKMEDLHEMFGSDYIHTDFILATDDRAAEWLDLI